MIPEEARALFQYNDWANHRSLDATAQLSNEQFVKPLGSSFSSVRDTLMHVAAQSGSGSNGFTDARIRVFLISRIYKPLARFANIGRRRQKPCSTLFTACRKQNSIASLNTRRSTLGCTPIRSGSRCSILQTMGRTTAARLRQ